MNPDRKKTVSLLAIPLLLVFIALLALHNSPLYFEPPLLLALLNTVFLGLFPLIIAFLAYRSFRHSGSYCILLLGCGLLAMGLGSIAAGWLNNLSDGANLTPTIHNTAFFLGGLLVIASVALISSGPPRRQNSTGSSLPLLCYACIAAFITVFCLADVVGLIPVFFVQASGPTAIRQVILSNALTFFALASLLFYLLYSKRKETLFFWFSIAMAYIAIGLFAIFFQQSVGSLIGWAGRIAQYAGATIALAAIIALYGRASRDWVTLQDRMMRAFLSGAATQTLTSVVGAAILLFDRDRTILMANQEAIWRLGKEKIGDVLGHSIHEFADPSVVGMQIEKLNHLLISRQPIEFENEHDGRVYHTRFFPVYDADGGISTILAISSDITDRKRTEETLQKSQERLTLSLEAAGQAAWDYDITTDTMIASDRMLAIYGIAPGHSLHTMEDWHTMILKEDLHAIRQHVDRADPAAGIFHTEFRIRRGTDGAIRWISSDGAIIRDTDGRPVRRIGVLSDVTLRKEGEEALAQSRAKIIEILDSIQDDLYRIDRDWTIILTSRQFASRFGKKPADLVRKNFWETLPKYQGTSIEETFRRVMETKELERFEMIEPYTGIWYNTTVFPSEEGITVLATDITARKHAEAALRESEERYRHLVDLAPDAILVHQDGRYVYTNPAGVRLFGAASADDILGQKALDLVPEEEREIIASRMRDVLGEKERTPLADFHIIRFDGTLMEVGVTGSKITFDGRPAIQIIVRDITERRKTERALKESEEHYRLLHDTMIQGVVYQKADGTIVSMNSAAVKILGKTPEEFLGETSVSVEHDTIREDGTPFPGMDHPAMVTLRTGQIIRGTIMGVYNPREKMYRWIEIDAIPVFLRGKSQPCQVYTVFSDITENKRAGEALRASLAEKETLVREVHHRVKNNLQVISGLVDMTRTRAQDETTSAILTDLMLKIHTMAQIHTHLYEGGDVGRVNIREQVQEQVAALALIYAGRDRSISCGITSDDILLPVDRAVPCALVINEILANAFKHAFRGRTEGKIEITLAQQDGRVRITIQDNGIGIPTDFEIGRSDSLGMKLVQALVQHQLGGTLVITARNGTEVVVEFPIRTPEEA